MRSQETFLSQYDFKFIHTIGKENLEADCLSQNPVLEANETEQLKTINLINLETIFADQKLNKDIQCNREKSKLVERQEIYFKKVRIKEKNNLSEELSMKLMKKVHQNL